jgi:hypothetical protein
MSRRRVAIAVFVAALAAAPAAQSDPVPALSTPPSVGEIATGRARQLAAAGFVEQEFFLEGTAHSYTKRGEWTSDGAWDVAVGETAPYKIRILARYPKQSSRFNGVVFVEWLNVSGQSEGDPNFTVLHEELLRDGYAYVGVGAQAAGINGANGLKRFNAERYASVNHPGDSYSYDIYSQAGRIIRSAKGPLGALTGRIRALLADGESQSANRLVTYVNAVHPVAQVYDGFLIHSRVGSSGTPLTQSPGAQQLAIAGTPPTRIRGDLKVPVFVIQTEGDVPTFIEARQPDTARLRTWEIAGTAHADRYLLTNGGAQPMAVNCEVKDPKLNVPINDGPMTYPMRAALRHMKGWLAGGTPPPSAPPLVTDGATLRRDPLTGNALGGVRTPQVDVPTRTLYGIRAPAGGGQFCFMFGRTDEWNGDADPWDGGPADPSPNPEPVLSRLYPTKADYTAKFDQAIAAGVKAGFLLKEDVTSLRAEAARVALK